MMGPANITAQIVNPLWESRIEMFISNYPMSQNSISRIFYMKERSIMNEVQCKPQFDKQGVIGKNPKIIMRPSSFIRHPRRYVHGLGISMRNEIKMIFAICLRRDKTGFGMRLCPKLFVWNFWFAKLRRLHFSNPYMLFRIVMDEYWESL